jgi:hypothetical protein
MKKIVAKLTPPIKGMDPRPKGCFIFVFIAAFSAVSVLVTAALRHH